MCFAAAIGRRIDRSARKSSSSYKPSILARTGCYCKFDMAAQPCFCLSGLRPKIQAARFAVGG
jgi:hypothetical protein